MITTTAKDKEILVAENLEWNTNLLRAAASLKELLSQIDFNAEILPTTDRNRLTNVFVSLKGEPLDKYEAAVVDEIVEASNIV